VLARLGGGDLVEKPGKDGRPSREEGRKEQMLVLPSEDWGSGAGKLGAGGKETTRDEHRIIARSAGNRGAGRSWTGTVVQKRQRGGESLRTTSISEGQNRR